VVWPETKALGGEIFEIGETCADAPTPGHTRPLYIIAVAGTAASSLSGVVPVISVLADRDEWVYHDYERVTRDLGAAHTRGNALAVQVEELQRHHAEAVRQRDALQAASGALQARHAAELAEQRTEIARRAGLRWWLELPLRRVWRALTGRPPAA
jgi:hypothetical protein